MRGPVCRDGPFCGLRVPNFGLRAHCLRQAGCERGDGAQHRGVVRGGGHSQHSRVHRGRGDRSSGCVETLFGPKREHPRPQGACGQNARRVHLGRPSQHPRRQRVQLRRGKPGPNAARRSALAERGFGGDLVVLPAHGARGSGGGGEILGLGDVRIWGVQRGHPHADRVARGHLRNPRVGLQWRLPSAGFGQLALVARQLHACVERHGRVASPRVWEGRPGGRRECVSFPTRPTCPQATSSGLRGHLKARWKPSSTWQIGGAVQAQYQQMGRFILWDDFATSAYLPMEGTSSEDRWINWHADAWASCTPEEGGSHHLQTRVYQTSRYGSGPDPSMTSTLSMLQYRHVREVGEHGLAQVGAFASAQNSFSSLYPDIELLTFNPAVFAQIDWERDLWKWTAGVRAEANENPGFYSESSGPTFRFGVNRGLGARNPCQAVVRRVPALRVHCGALRGRHASRTASTSGATSTCKTNRATTGRWGWSTRSNQATSLGCWMRRRLSSITTT